METSKYLTKALIPSDGVWVSETFAPKGFTVAKYDVDGFATAPRWFESLEAAHACAEKICKDGCLIAEGRGTHLKCNGFCGNV